MSSGANSQTAKDLTSCKCGYPVAPCEGLAKPYCERKCSMEDKRSAATPRNGCQIVHRDERWWFIRPNGQWVGPYRTREDAERKSAP